MKFDLIGCLVQISETYITKFKIENKGKKNKFQKQFWGKITLLSMVYYKDTYLDFFLGILLFYKNMTLCSY